jgi:TPR repeat protein
VDAKEAFECFQRAADKGLPQAEFELGLCYYKGYGTEADLLQGYTWVNLAAQRSVPAAASVRDEMKEQLTAEQIAEADRRVAALAPGRPKIVAQDPDFDEERTPNEE